MVESLTTRVSVEKILKETHQQISLYDLMVLSPIVREDAMKVLQSLPMVGSSGGHLPILERELEAIELGCLTVESSSSLTDYKSLRLTVCVSSTTLPGAIVDGGST